jgi:hypothetical protein
VVTISLDYVICCHRAVEKNKRWESHCLWEHSNHVDKIKRDDSIMTSHDKQMSSLVSIVEKWHGFRSILAHTIETLSFINTMVSFHSISLWFSIDQLRLLFNALLQEIVCLALDRYYHKYVMHQIIFPLSMHSCAYDDDDKLFSINVNEWNWELRLLRYIFKVYLPNCTFESIDCKRQLR